ncbi:hypothetical protein FB451DRAFT_1442691, partial [Mycena latifolia]
MTASNIAQGKIAIVGVAAQIPSGDPTRDDLNYCTFWDFLINERQAYEPLNPALFNASQFGDLERNMNLPAKGAFLKNPNGLDTIAFGISAKDARVMPFTARRLMEQSFLALLDSGINYRKEKVGCFMSGVSNFEVEVTGSLRTDGSFAAVPSALANRISYLLDITGPSVQVDTACSSSLTALHLAILAIESGDCNAAIIGAAQMNREVGDWKNYVAGGVLSADGTTKPFDASADGFGRGEGVVVVVAKLLEDALRDNDHIYSVILGSAINSTGSRMPLNVPSAVAQKECIQTAYTRAGRNLSDVDYVELHITGTPVGDRIEANAAGEIFGGGSGVAVGSVKGNIGHLEAAAFLVSLVKACLILENKTIPPTVNLSEPSPEIKWHEHRLFVPTDSIPLGCRSGSGQSIISLSGAGIGGSTGHVVIGSPPTRLDSSSTEYANSSTVTFIVGGLSPRATAHICQSIREVNFSDAKDLRACAVTLSRRARQLPWRTFFTMPSSPYAEIASATLVPTFSPPMAFVFSGQGAQNLEMGRGLFAEFPVFRATILELDEIYRKQVGESLLETTGLFLPGGSLRSNPPMHLSSTGWPVTITVSAIAMLQMALFDLLASVGITPSSLTGHSAGETAVLYASGAGSKAMALEIAIARGQAMSATESETVGMASLGCSADRAEQIISQLSPTQNMIEISCFNSPHSVALSGSVESLEKVIAVVQAAGIFVQRIKTMVPGHSSFMDKIKDDYLSRMIDIFDRYPGPHIPDLPVFSTCSGETLVHEFSASYFWDNCRNPVLFSPAISNLLKFHASIGSTPVVFLEISCHAVLSSSILRHGVSEKLVLCPMRRLSPTNPNQRSVNEQTLFTETLARITLLGYNSCDISGLYGPSVFKPVFIDHPLVSRSIPLPKTHFSSERRDKSVNGPLSAANLSITERTHPLLAQHIINGEPILPATGFLEMVLKSGANYLWDVEFTSFFSLSARTSACIMLERSGCHWSLKSTHPVDASVCVKIFAARKHARGLMDTSFPVKPGKVLNLQSIWDRLPAVELEGFYQSLEPFATFGPAYRRVICCHGRPSEVIAEIEGPSLDECLDQYKVHPMALDACLHIMLHPQISNRHGQEAMYLPSKLGSFVYHGPGLPGNWLSHIKRRAWSPSSKSYDIVVADVSGSAICELHDLVVQKLSEHTPAVRRRLDMIFQPVSVRTIIASPYATYSKRESQVDTRKLLGILDGLALKMITKSLQEPLSIGTDVSFAISLHWKTSNVGQPDIGYFLQALAAELARNITYNRVTPKLYDLTKDPGGQGLLPESYDMIVALHVLHAVPDTRACLLSLQGLLVPGGSLLVIELDGTSWGERVGSVWFDCIFGSFPEWFGWTDGRLHCTMAPISWMQQLEDLGFINNHATDSGIDSRCVIQYSFGKEMELQSRLRLMSPKDKTEVYLVSLEGRDGDAGMGLCATLAREFPFWDIFLGIFESQADLSHPLRRISNHLGLFKGGEPAVYFPRDRSPCVPRLVLSPAPPILPDGPSIALGDSDHLVVEMINVQQTTFPVHGFVGRVIMSHRRTPSRGDLVAGITHQNGAPILNVHIGCVVSLDGEQLNHLAALPDPADLMKRTAALLVLECLPKRSHSPIKVVLAVADEDMSAVITKHLEAIETVGLVSCDFKDGDQPLRVDVVVSDSATKTQYPHIRRWVSRSGRFLLWDDIVRDNIRDDTRQMRDALRLSLQVDAHPQTMTDQSILRGMPVLTNDIAYTPLFLHDKSYILIGGIGGLGVDLAVWMYQNGARHLILTSRRGIESLDPQRDDEALSKVAYLRRCTDLELRLEKCDGTDAHATSSLVKTLLVPIAGCFQMTLVLSDALFLKQTQASFTAVYDSKIKVFEIFAAEVDIKSLDFYIAFSSLAGLLGQPGQSNYSSACTILDGILARYPNAFSLIVPGIGDVGYLIRTDSRHVDTGGFISAGSISAAKLWTYIEDSLRKLRHGSPPFSKCIPDLDWKSVHAHAPLSTAFRYVLSSGEQSLPGPHATRLTSEDDILRILLSLVEVEKEDFDFERPLLSYGLDSLSATRLSHALEPFVSVSQVQLLAGVSWAELRAGLRLPSGDEDTSERQYRLAREAASINVSVPNHDNLEFPVDSIVEICSGDGVPLIVFPGADGSIGPLMALRTHFSGNLWGLHVNESAPTTTFSGLATFFAAKIREKQPSGPYRLAAYSAGCLISVAVAILLEESGQQVQQLSFIDHFPALWTNEAIEISLREQPISSLLDQPIKSMIEMLQIDPVYRDSENIVHLEAALTGSPDAAKSGMAYVDMTRRLSAPLLEFLVDFYPQNAPRTQSSFTDPFIQWVSSVKAPLSVLIAEFGTITTLATADRDAWRDLGARFCHVPVTTQFIPGVGHYGILADKQTAACLQQWGLGPEVA